MGVDAPTVVPSAAKNIGAKLWRLHTGRRLGLLRNARTSQTEPALDNAALSRPDYVPATQPAAR